MDIDILSPEFIAFSEEVKKLYAEKEKKNTDFKAVYMKHKADLDAIDKKADDLKAKLFGKEKKVTGKSAN